MRRSEDIAQLATALAKAQGAMQNAAKSATNPHFHNKYADLADIIEAARKPFADVGLAYTQPLRYEDSSAIITTLLMHGESGQWIEEELSIPMTQVTSQSIGSAATYAKRYSLAAMLGIAGEVDDDANAAIGYRQDRREEAPPPPRPNGEVAPSVKPAPARQPKSKVSFQAEGWGSRLRNTTSLDEIQKLKTSTQFTGFWSRASKDDRDYVTSVAVSQQANLERDAEDEKALKAETPPEPPFSLIEFIAEVRSHLEDLQSFDQIDAMIAELSQPVVVTGEVQAALDTLKQEQYDRLEYEAIGDEEPPAPPVTALKTLPKDAGDTPENRAHAERQGEMAALNGDPNIIPEYLKFLPQALGNAWHRGWESQKSRAK